MTHEVEVAPEGTRRPIDEPSALTIPARRHGSGLPVANVVSDRRAHTTGVVLALSASVAFAIMNALIKVSATGHPLTVGVWTRYVVHALIMLVAIGLMQRRLRDLRAAHLRGQIVRGVLLLTATVTSFVALAALPLPEATAILLTGPVMLTALAVPLLHERAGMAGWAGLVTAFLGATLIIRPGTGLFNVVALVPLAAALADSLYQIVTRRMRHQDSPTTTLFYTGLVGAVIMTPVVLLHPAELTVANILPFVTVGAAGAAAHLSLLLALRAAPMVIVAPVAYAGLIWATIIGATVFGTLPDPFAILGMTAIGCGGLLAFRSRDRGPEREATAIVS